MVENSYTEEEARFREFRSGLLARMRNVSGIHSSIRESHYENLLFDLYTCRQRLNLWSKATPFDDDQYLIVGFEEELNFLENRIKQERDGFVFNLKKISDLEKSKSKHPDSQNYFEMEE